MKYACLLALFAVFLLQPMSKPFRVATSLMVMHLGNNFDRGKALLLNGLDASGNKKYVQSMMLNCKMGSEQKSFRWAKLSIKQTINFSVSGRMIGRKNFVTY